MQRPGTKARTARAVFAAALAALTLAGLVLAGLASSPASGAQLPNSGLTEGYRWDATRAWRRGACPGGTR